jgi:hypothetical protein
LAKAVAQATGAQQTEGAGSKGQTIVPASCRGGSCAAYQKDTYVRGVVGHCLQRDYSRILGGAKDMNPCLIWPARSLSLPADRRLSAACQFGRILLPIQSQGSADQQKPG